jgi:hypothetical protein
VAKDWDLTSSKSGALMVAIIRVDDLAVAADPQLAPRDSVNLIEDRASQIWDRLKEQRAEEQAKQDRARQRAEKRGR